MIKTTREIVSKVHKIIGTSLLGAAATTGIIGLLLSHPDATLALKITAASLALPSIIMLSIGAGFSSKDKKVKANLERLQSTGDKFKADITGFNRHIGINSPNWTSLYVDCTYTNKDGQKITVSSDSLCFHGTKMPIPQNYKATVYVNPRNNQDCAVLITK